MKYYVYRIETGETRYFTIEGRYFKFKGGYYRGKKSDRKYLQQVNHAYPILDEDDELVNPYYAPGITEKAFVKTVEPPEQESPIDTGSE